MKLRDVLKNIQFDFTTLEVSMSYNPDFLSATFFAIKPLEDGFGDFEVVMLTKSLGKSTDSVRFLLRKEGEKK